MQRSVVAFALLMLAVIAPAQEPEKYLTLSGTSEHMIKNHKPRYLAWYPHNDNGAGEWESPDPAWFAVVIRSGDVVAVDRVTGETCLMGKGTVAPTEKPECLR